MKDKTFGEICGNKHNGKCPNCPACEHNRLYRGLQREQKMKNKLKKIETLNPNEYNGGHGNYVEDTFYKIEKKINEIIDYINEKEQEMKNKKQDKPLCVMCHEELVGVNIRQGDELGALLFVCKNRVCSNFSLLALPEGAIRDEVII